MPKEEVWEVVIVGAGFAGLSAAIYLGRARRQVLVLHNGQSMAVWEPHVQNYMGFPDGIAGEELLRRGRHQAQTYGVTIHQDLIREGRGAINDFSLIGKQRTYTARRVLLATGIFHIPPEIPDLDECLGESMFFCKDCDGYRVQDKKVGIIGRSNEAVEYALGMLTYSPAVFVLTNGKKTCWDGQHADWLRTYDIPVFEERIAGVDRVKSTLRGLTFKDGQELAVDALFTTRGDVVHNRLAKTFGARLDDSGQIIVNEDCRSTVDGLYAAGCVTAANCQMIIAAGQGATAAQAINRNLFEESLATHSLRRLRKTQIQTQQTEPEIIGQR